MIEAADSLAIPDGLLSRLVLQPADDPLQDICSYYAAANLFVISGLEPPPVSKMVEFIKSLAEHKDSEGLTGSKIIQLLQSFGFPRQLGVTSLLPTAGLCGFVKQGLESDFSYVLLYCWVVELTLDAALFLTGDKDYAGLKVWITHSLIPLSVDIDRKEMDCIIGWEQLPVAKVKVQEIMYPDWFWMGCGLQPLGFARGILMVWPDVRAGREN